jgi:hypothetical protein
MNAIVMRIVAMLAVVAALLAAGQALAQPPKSQPPTADFTVEVLGAMIVEFAAKMDEYAALRASLQQGLPALAVTDNPTEIQRAERLLAARIRRARSGADRHDIFTEESRRAFRQLLRPLATPGNCAFIADDNPGEWRWAVNSEYPKERNISSVPPSMLAALPQLPEDVYYRFLDTDLVLHDTRANIMLDRIDNAIRCH